MESLHYFVGRSTDDAIFAIAAEKGVRLDPSLVRKMVDFALLVPPENREDSLSVVLLWQEAITPSGPDGKPLRSVTT